MPSSQLAAWYQLAPIFFLNPILNTVAGDALDDVLIIVNSGEVVGSNQSAGVNHATAVVTVIAAATAISDVFISIPSGLNVKN
jgi:hypothetical protein